MRKLRGRGVAAAGIAALLLAAAAVDGFLIEPNRLVFRRITLPCEGLRRGVLRILLFADVDFQRPGRREDAIRGGAVSFDPDLVLVAGDFLDRPSATRDRAVLHAAGEFLRSLPAPAGRFLAPGEKEAEALGRIRDAFSDGAIEVLSNETRSLDVRGEKVDLFVANPPAEPAPWGIATDAERSFAYSRGRFQDQMLVYGGEDAAVVDWGDAEFTFAFMALDRASLVDFRFAWQEGADPSGGRGFSIVRDEYRTDLRILAYGYPRHVLDGSRLSGFVPPAGVWCRARVRMEDNGDRTRVRARFWRESEAEPHPWSIDVVDRNADRPRRGTVGFAGHAGGRRCADLRVVTQDGRVLLDEPFRDRARLRGNWHYRSALADWALGPGSEEAASRPGHPRIRQSARATRILLAHDPDVVLDLLDIGAPPPSIVLSGHTHGGQIRLPWIGALYTSTHLGRRYDKGLFDYFGIPLFITSGVGTSKVPIRFFDPHEIVLLTLTPPGGPR